ncbi:MAG: hypothetical protein ACUVXJ_00645 [Phycisphaerae bacterium]
MSDERLEQLLRQADEAFGRVPCLAANLGARVRRQARRRRRVMVVTSAAAAMLALVVSAIALRSERGTPPWPEGPLIADKIAAHEQVVQLQAEIDRLKEEIARHARVVEEARRRAEIEQRLAALKQQAAIDPLQEVSDQVDRAALIMVYQADRMCRELNLREAAMASYERTIELFPKTHWAQVAKDRLAELKTAGNGDSI